MNIGLIEAELITIQRSGESLVENLMALDTMAVELCKEYRLAQRELSEKIAKINDPSLSSEDKRRQWIRDNTIKEIQRADYLGDLVSLVKQRIELGTLLLSISGDVEITS